MKILVTGGSGFIGSVLVRQLLATGHDVQIYDKAPSEAFPALWIKGDVRDAPALTKACEAADVVVHLAAEHADNVTPVSLYYDVNVGGARNLVEAATVSGTRAIIFTSTVAVYGLDAGIADENNPISPFNDYGKSKFEAEQILSDWQAGQPDRRLVIVRPSVVFGEGNRGNVYNLIRLVHDGRFLMVGKGENRKSMSYVENVAAFLASRLEGQGGREVFNYADTPDLSTADLIEVVRRELGLPASKLRLPLPIGLAAGHTLDAVSAVSGLKFPISAIRIRKFNADTQVSSARALQTGFAAHYTIAEGLRRMIAHEFPR
jgi:nucleoside-diphosphate-sugar epimerase